MAQRRHCNGCGRPVGDKDFHEVQVTKATLSGAGRSFGLASDEVTVGELCGPCYGIVKSFVGDSDEEEAADARSLIAPRSAAA